MNKMSIVLLKILPYHFEGNPDLLVGTDIIIISFLQKGAGTYSHDCFAITHKTMKK